MKNKRGSMKVLFLALFAVLFSFGLFAQEEEDVNASIATVKDIFKEEYKKLKTPEDRKALAKKLLEQAADDYTTATAVSTNAERIATKAKNKGLAAKANGKKKEVTAALNSLKTVSVSIDTLKANPDDPEANLAVEKYTCFTKGDWDKGLPMLAKCSDKDYKGASTRATAKHTKTTHHSI